MTQESDRYFLPKPAEIFTIELRARFVLRRLLHLQQRRTQLLRHRTNTSFSPSSREIKPKPFSELKNFTVPVVTTYSIH